MITSINIQNFKSIQSLDLELGRLNVFIGANGSGKSNILEAFAMGSAAMDDKLDNEFLASRGIRVTDPALMKAGFEKENRKKSIFLTCGNEAIEWQIELFSSNDHFNNWRAKTYLLNIKENYEKAKQESNRQLIRNTIKRDLEIAEEKTVDIRLKNVIKIVREFLINKDGELKDFSSVKNENPQLYESIINLFQDYDEIYDFTNFLIYAPENHFLRRFEDETQIRPLGIKGEGLFKLLTIISEENPEQFQEIKSYLSLMDWFEDFDIPNDLKFTEKRIKIKDAYLEEGLQYFDQRSANEGFLYLLFYLTLFISNETPSFFAIDNIDNSLNPKLGSELIKLLVKLSRSHDKQAILTTHNPVILDGLDLSEDDQRLFVVYRNADGHTKVRRIKEPKPVNGSGPVRLSEAFIRGYIGGLPKNF